MITSFDDARRFVDLAKGGWVDDTVNLLEAIEILCDIHDDAVVLAEDNARDEKAQEFEDEIADLKRQCNFEGMEHDELVMALERITRCLRDAHKYDVRTAEFRAERRIRAELTPPPPTPEQIEEANRKLKKRRGRPRKTETP